MSLARNRNTATLLPDGRVLAAGGTNNGSAVLASSEVFDPATSTWATVGKMSFKREGHAAALLAGGRVLVAGGNPVLNGVPLAQAELFNPTTGRWVSAGRMIVGRYYFTLTRLNNGKVLAVGGCNQANCLTVTPTAELYDPATMRWYYTGSLTTARDYHTATLLSDGRVLVTGGYTAGGASNSAEIYDPATGTWSVTGNMLKSRTYHTAILLPTGNVLVVGNAGGYDNSAEVFTPSLGVFTATNPMSKGRESLTAVRLGNGKVLVTGGRTYSRPTPQTLAEAELYDSFTASWSPTGSMSQGRSDHSCVVLANGNAIAFGGLAQSSGPLASSELYTY